MGLQVAGRRLERGVGFFARFIQFVAGDGNSCQRQSSVALPGINLNNFAIRRGRFG